MKQAIKNGHQRGVPLEQTLASFLLHYRTIPHATTGVAPSSLFLGHSLRTCLDLLRPDVETRVRDMQSRQKDYRDKHSRDRQFTVGQTVMVENKREGSRRLKGVVVNCLGLSYLVELRGGVLWRRHVDHL